MYNSIFLNLLMGLASLVQRMYKNSILCSILTKINRMVSPIYLNSYTSKTSVIFRYLFFNSIVYRTVENTLLLVDKLLNSLNSFKEKLSLNSKVSEGLSFYSKDLILGLRLFYEVFILLGVFLLIGNGLGISWLPYFVNIGLIILGLIGLFINGLEGIIIENSIVMNFFLDLFKLDEGGENW